MRFCVKTEQKQVIVFVMDFFFLRKAIFHLALFV
jgi:hypothetical protein